jgi:hypothetical protein
MMRTALFLAAALAWAAPACAQSQELALGAGETVIVRLNEGAITEASRAPAQLSELDRRYAAEADRGEHNDAGGANAKPISSESDYPKAVPAAPGTLRFTFAPTDGGGMLLSIANGYGSALVYRATMWVEGKAQPTDVCLVLPKRSGIEHWPHRIDRIVLSDLHFMLWMEGDPVSCS